MNARAADHPAGTTPQSSRITRIAGTLPTSGESAETASPAEPSGVDPDEAGVEFLLRFTLAAHDAGYTTEELEERVTAVAAALGFADVEVSSTPTLVELSVGALASQRTSTLRVRPAGVDLGTIARLDDLARALLDGRLDAPGGLEALGALGAGAVQRSWPVVVVAYGLAGATMTPMLGGAWREACAAAVVGAVVGGILLPAQRSPRAEAITVPLAAVAASLTAAFVTRAGLRAAPDTVTLAALVTLLPGMALTVGVRELASDQLQSGVANTARATVQLLGLVFGVEIGRSIAISWLGAPVETLPHVAFGWTQAVAALAAGLAYTVRLRAQTRDALVMCSATVLARVANVVGADLFGRHAGVFGAAWCVGVAGGVFGRVRRRSSLVFAVPGVFMLAPGSAGFDSINRLLLNEPVSAITAGFETFITATSIGYGLMLAALLLPSRFTRVTSPRPRRRSRA